MERHKKSKKFISKTKQILQGETEWAAPEEGVATQWVMYCGFSWPGWWPVPEGKGSLSPPYHDELHLPFRVTSSHDHREKNTRKEGQNPDAMIC